MAGNCLTFALSCTAEAVVLPESRKEIGDWSYTAEHAMNTQETSVYSDTGQNLN